MKVLQLKRKRDGPNKHCSETIQDHSSCGRQLLGHGDSGKIGHANEENAATKCCQ